MLLPESSRIGRSEGKDLLEPDRPGGRYPVTEAPSGGPKANALHAQTNLDEGVSIGSVCDAPFRRIGRG